MRLGHPAIQVIAPLAKMVTKTTVLENTNMHEYANLDVNSVIIEDFSAT